MAGSAASSCLHERDVSLTATGSIIESCCGVCRTSEMFCAHNMLLYE